MQNQVDFDETKWQQWTASTLLQWMENIQYDYKTSDSITYQQKDQFREFARQNPLRINLPSRQSQEKFNRISNQMIDFWDRVDTSQEVTREEEKDFAKHILQDFQVLSGERSAQASEKVRARAREWLRGQGPREQFQVIPVVKAIQQTIYDFTDKYFEVLDFLPPHSTQGKSYDDMPDKKRKSDGFANSADNHKVKQPSTKKPKRDKGSPKPPTPKPHGKFTKDICPGCGYSMKVADNGTLICPRNNDQGCGSDNRRNTSSSTWRDSAVGKAWWAKGYAKLPGNPNLTVETAPPCKSKKQNSMKKGEICNAITTNILDHVLIPFYLKKVTLNPKVKRKEANQAEPSFKLLLDTGAVGVSIISPSFSSVLHDSKYIIKVVNSNIEISTATQEQHISKELISFTIYVFSEQRLKRKRAIPIQVTAATAPISVDLILDRTTIQKNNLVQLFPRHFTEGQLADSIESTTPKELALMKTVQPKRSRRPTPRNLSNVNSYIASIAQARRSYINMLNSKYQENYKDKLAYTNASNFAYLASYSTGEIEHQDDDLYQTPNYEVYLAQLSSNFSRKAAYIREGNIDDIPDNKLESIPTEIIAKPTQEPNCFPLSEGEIDETHLVEIQGPDWLQTETRMLLKAYKEIFRSTVQPEPAKLEPFKLEIDLTKWHTPANMTKARPTDSERAKALAEMLDILIDNQVIEPCNESYYSHAFLVPKPNGKWRLVLDFKNLNAATIKHHKWPIPNIKEMLNRIGESRPHLFGVFDLTSGYYQAPIHENSKPFTAFATKQGVYRWKRLPMGLTGAGSYFQHSLVTQVLNGLITHQGCELYLDNCLVHAQTTEQYLERL